MQCIKRMTAGAVVVAAIFSAAAPARAQDEAKPVVTQHRMALNGASLAYTASTGMMPIRNKDGVNEGNIFYVYYKARWGPCGLAPGLFHF